MVYAVLRPMPSPTRHKVCKLVYLADTRQEAREHIGEDGDELWLVVGARWIRLSLGDAPAQTADGQLVLF